MRTTLIFILSILLGNGLLAQTQNNLEVDGQIKSNSLVGNGTRNVMAQSDGALITTNQQVEYYSLSGADFQPTEIDITIDAVTDYGAGAYFINASSGIDMVAPVHLPHGSIVKKITIRYLDNDESNNIYFIFGYTNNTTGTEVPYFNILSSDTPGGPTVHSTGPISLPIDNMTNAYHYRMNDSISGALNSNFKIFSVVFEYIRG